MSVNSKMTAIANAIRAKRSISGALSLDQMATEISSIQTGITPTGTKSITANGIHDVTSFASANVSVPVPGDTTATAAQILSGKTAYVGGTKVTGTQKCKMFLWTNPSYVNDSKRHTIVSQDPDLLAQRNNGTLFASYCKIGLQTADANGVHCGVEANGYMLGGDLGGTYIRHTTSGASQQGLWSSGLRDTGNANAGHLAISTDGTLSMFAHSTYGIDAGTYMITVGWN